MSSEPINIEIKTSDKSLFADLKSENIPDLQISFHSNLRETRSWIPSGEQLVWLVISTYTIDTLRYLQRWFFARIKRTKKTEKIYINDTDIVGKWVSP